MESNTRRRVWAYGWQDEPLFNRVWNSTLLPPPHFGIILRSDGIYQRIFFSVFPPSILTYDVSDTYLNFADAIARGGLIPEW